MALEDDILELILRQPGLMGREVAQRLGVEKAVANAALFKLKARRLVSQDTRYRWSPREGDRPKPDVAQEAQDTPLSRLCRYYLHCLSLDDENGISLFASSYHELDYVELPVLPEFDAEARPITSHKGVGELLSRLRRSTSRQVPYLGYPVRLRLVKGKSGWEGFKVEPLFVFEFGDEALQSGNDAELSGETPSFNFRVLKSFAVGDDSHVMDEAARLMDELGLGGVESPDFDDVIARLVEIRPEWDWREGIDPTNLSSGASLAEIVDGGIYNRAIVFGCERSPFTKGLEQELAKLQAMPETSYRKTALGAWMSREFGALRIAGHGDAELIEPLPLNSEQREAVENALTRPLTVVTGPPGTGKSQVVSSILINAAKRNQRVLFVSKNNKAVDVVEARVNDLGSRPILLRLGRGPYQAALSDYLTRLLASRATPEDAENYREAERAYESVRTGIRNLQKRAANVVVMRNAVDSAEQGVEALRVEIGAERFRRFCSMDADALHRASEGLRVAAKGASRAHQSFFTRMFWFASRNSRLAQLLGKVEEHQAAIAGVGVDKPQSPSTDADVLPWLDATAEFARRVEQVRLASEYSTKLKALEAGDKIEDLTAEIARLTRESSSVSMNVWESWLRLAPSRLTANDRRLLGEFNAVIRLIAASDETQKSAGKAVFARYYRLFPQIVSQLPCWAVTSLSARGRIPLDAAFFDLLVVDEASQCDIASLLPLLFRAKAAVVIGDPMQLRHISAISPRRDRDLLQQHELTETHLNWAFSENSVFDLASPLATADDIVMLRDHHRSHADVIGFSNEHFYGGRLRMATNYDRLKHPSTTEPAVRWSNVTGRVTRPGSGALNELEAQAVVREIERLIVQQSYRGSVGVVTPFRAQANRIRDILHAHPQAGLILGQGELIVDTVHRFQGDERDVMLFSPVVSDGIAQGPLGFLRKTPNLFNVAITRARAALVIVGDMAAAKQSGIEHLVEFAIYVESLALGRRARAISDDGLYDGGPKYPSVTRPELVSAWEPPFYCELYSAGFRPIPQYDVEKFILDFALIAGARRLDIEVDGERYHRDWNGELLRRDQLRNMRLIELGWDVMRFWVYELRDNMPACIERVRSWVAR